MKKLYRSTSNRQLCGVCGGVGEYLGVDPTVVRVVWVIAALFGTIGIWAYLLCALIIPEDSAIR
ncbi:MAG: PspC domain-containing protein [Clostridia bacterium]|nr:PspC domain-containing protein [Clostridia bacterium]